MENLTGSISPTELPQVRQRLLKMALRLTNDHHEAEDIVQDVFVKAIQCEHQLPVGMGLFAYLVSIQHNLFVDYLRRKKVALLPMDPQNSSHESREANPFEALLREVQSKEQEDIIDWFSTRPPSKLRFFFTAWREAGGNTSILATRLGINRHYVNRYWQRLVDWFLARHKAAFEYFSLASWISILSRNIEWMESLPNGKEDIRRWIIKHGNRQGLFEACRVASLLLDYPIVDEVPTKLKWLWHDMLDCFNVYPKPSKPVKLTEPSALDQMKLMCGLIDKQHTLAKELRCVPKDEPLSPWIKNLYSYAGLPLPAFLARSNTNRS